VAKIRKLLGVKKVGHCGTLDPFASGVLPICVGSATRVVRYMDKYDKTYRCTAHFGAYTDTQDREGKITGGKMPSPEELILMKADDFSSLRALFAALNGDMDQMPPMYSAIKMGGHPLYEYARKGITLERLTRRIHVYDCIVHKISADEMLLADFSLSCSKGTYIRTICDELGRDSGFGAYADALERTRCGPFLIDASFTLEEIEQLFTSGQTSEFLLPEELAVAHMPRFEVSQQEADNLRLGRQMPLEYFEDRMAISGPAATEGTEPDEEAEITEEAEPAQESDPDEQNALEDPDKPAAAPRFCAYYRGELLAIVFPDEKEGRMILRIERMLA